MVVPTIHFLSCGWPNGAGGRDQVHRGGEGLTVGGMRPATSVTGPQADRLRRLRPNLDSHVFRSFPPHRGGTPTPSRISRHFLQSFASRPLFTRYLKTIPR